ncbi:MAG: pilus assembly protein [Clostridiales bacterium]|nr:pilus assembly protein [Clostridiales bacterium]
MLFLKHEKKLSDILNDHKNNNLARSLQAQVILWLRKRKKASCPASCNGSATVETVLVFPIFLYAICALMMVGHLMMTEGKIQYAVAKTADKCAMYSAMIESSGDGSDDGDDVGSSLLSGIGETLVSNVSAVYVFSTVYESSSVDENCILGGRAGIIVTEKKGDNNTVKVTATYLLRVKMPFIGSYNFPRTTSVTQRIFSGYTDHGSEEESEDDEIVYVTETGTVYHTSASCSHICLTISGASAKSIIAGHEYDACEKCIKDGEIPSTIYVTKYGEKYHSSLNCSGLKRTIKTMKKSEVGNMRMCSRCAAAAGE